MKYCDQEFRPCPYRVVDLRQGVFCNFHKEFADSGIHSEWDKVEYLIDRACPKIKSTIRNHKYIVNKTQEQEKKFLDRVNVGDIVYCTAELHNVIFLEMPKYEFGYCKYKTRDGTIKEAPTFCFSLISKGDKYIEYEIKEKWKADYFKHLAKSNGFRVEMIKSKNSYFLKIYGDTQEEVDDFALNLNSSFIYD